MVVVKEICNSPSGDLTLTLFGIDSATEVSGHSHIMYR